MKNMHHVEPQTITLAKVCEALANGYLSAECEDGMYVIRNSDLRRLLRATRPELALRARPVPVYTQQKAS